MRRHRTLSLVLAGLVTVGAIAGCSDDKKDSNDSGKDGGSQDSGTSGEASGKVKDYCDAVDAYIKKAKDVMADPTKGDAGSLSSEAQDLAAKATELSKGLTADEAKQVSDCSQKAASALTGG